MLAAPTCGLASLAPVFQPWGFLFEHSGELGLDGCNERPPCPQQVFSNFPGLHLRDVDSAPFSLVTGIMLGHAALHGQQRTC